MLKSPFPGMDPFLESRWPEVHASLIVICESVATVADPVVLKRAPHPTRHIEIVDHNGRVITAIQFISPWNKLAAVLANSTPANS